MILILLIVVVACFVLNLQVADDLSSAGAPLLCAELVAVLLVARAMVYKIVGPAGQAYCTKVYCAFLAFLALTLLYLHFCWTPFLSYESNDMWGFDPQRYYYYATQMIRSSNFEFGLNYIGVVYVYVALMTVFGVDPMVPLFLNVLLVALAVSYLTRLLYLRYGNDGYYRYTWLFFFLPEVVYYSALSSREVFCLTLVSLCVYLACNPGPSGRLPLAKMLLPVAGVLFIRPPFGFMLMLIIMVMSIKQNHALNLKRVFASIGAALILLAVAVAVGGAEAESEADLSSMSESLYDHVSGDVEAGEGLNYNANSLSLLLIPSNPVEFVVFGVVRSLLYLVPRSNPITTITAVFSDSYILSHLLVWITSFILMLSIPSLWRALREFRSQDQFFKTIFLSFGVFFLTVGMLNTNLIHERYRLVYDFLLLTVWLLVRQQRAMQRKRRDKPRR